MIKKKKKRKKNPFNRNDQRIQFLIEIEYIPILAKAIFYSDPKYLSDALTLYAHSGSLRHCWDCEKFYADCRCEYCKDCKFNRCLCNVSDKKVSQIGWELAEKTLNAAELDMLNDVIDLYYEEKIKRKN